MKPLSALLFVLAAQAIAVEAGLVGLRDAFFGTGPYAIAPLNRRQGGVEVPQICVGIEQAKRFQPHKANECRILEVTDPNAKGAWNYCPADLNSNCQIPMACVDEDLCKDNKCGNFGNKEYTTISCSDSYHCGHTVLFDRARSGADATRWVCDKTAGLVVSIPGTFKIGSGLRTFDGREASAVRNTTFVPGQTSTIPKTSSSSSTVSSSDSSSTITDAPVSVSTAIVTSSPTSNPDPAPKTNIAPIVGGAVGGFAVLALLGLAIFILWRRHKRTNFSAVPDARPNSDDSNDEKGLTNGEQTPGTGGTATSSWMPTPEPLQGTFTPNNDVYAGTVSEMPTPDMLGRDWNQADMAPGPHEMGTPTPTALGWAQPTPKAQGWGIGPVDPHKYEEHDLDITHEPTVAPGGLPASLTPGLVHERRAELA